MDVYGYGYVWICMDMYGYVWIYMDVYALRACSEVATFLILFHQVHQVRDMMICCVSVKPHV